MRYRVLAQTTPDCPVAKPSDIRGWLTAYDDAGDAWGARYTEETPTLDDGVSLGWLDFLSDEAPKLVLNQRVDLHAGHRLILVCWVLKN